MGLAHSPRIVTDGLVLALDAGSPKNYNVGISTNWTDKVGGNNGTLVGGTYHNDGPFVGAGYVEFDGTGDYLSLANNADHQFGSSDYTIEAWVYLNNLSTVQGLFGRYNTSSAREIYITLNTNGSITHRTSSNGTSFSTHSTSAGLLTAQTWHHVAISKSGTNSYIAVDGVVGSGTVDSTLHTASQTTYIGDAIAGSNLLNGNLSNYRILKGTALYTSNFTPPTKPLTAVTNTTLLTCQGNTIADASSSAHTITANGDISLTKEPFAGAGAVAFDGSDYLEIPASSDFSFTTAPWTFECWVYHKDWTTGADGNGFQYMLYPQQPSHPSYPVAIAVRQGYYVIVDSANYGSPWFSSYNNIGSYGTAASLNTWNHVAYTRDSSGVDRVFVNGTLQFSATGKTSTAPSISSVARFGGTGTAYINGYISNLRILKGTALYTSAFTPPSRTLEPIENTVLLTCQGQNIKDASSSAHTITPNGDVKATIVSSAFEFDGTNDYVEIPDSSDWDFGTGNFAIELFVKADSVSGTRPLLSVRQAGSGGWGVYFASNVVTFYSDSGSVFNYSTSSNSFSTTGVWRHVVVTRVGNTFTTYIDGVSKGTGTSTNSIDNSANDVLTIGKVWPSGMTYFDGSISGVKIYKGKGLTAAEVEQNYNATKGRYA